MIRTFLFLCLVALSIAAQDTLRLVNVLYRHGDRSPVTLYPKDPYQMKSWPQGLGWLSETGMRQQYALGQFLRTEYGQLLNLTYKNSEIVVEASNVNRCLMSAYCNLAGLYPPGKAQQWNPQLIWQPIPVHTRPENEDNKLAMEKPCARYDELYAQELNGPIIKQEEKVNAAFYKFVDNATGVKRENISEIWKVADTLYCENAHNFTLPPWTEHDWNNGTIFDKMMELRNFGFALLYNGTEMSRLKGGPLLKEFISNMQSVAADASAPHYKMYMYSAHDSTVAAVTGAMHVYNRLAPPYATAVLVELHEIDSKFCVEIRFRNETDHPPYLLMHPECQVQCCPLDKFIEVTKDRVPVDWEAECNNPTPSGSGSDDDLTSTTIGFLVLFIGTLMIMVALLFAYVRQRRVVKTFETLA